MDTVQTEMDRGINGSTASLYERRRAWKDEIFDYEYIESDGRAWHRDETLNTS